MSIKEATIERPKRWDAPFDSLMDAEQVDVILAFPPFRTMDPRRFPRSCGLADILRNDSRLVSFDSGDIVLREGDYGCSAFLILTGSVRVFLASLSPELLGRGKTKSMSWWQTLSQAWTNSQHREARSESLPKRSSPTETRRDAEGVKVFLQDFPGVIDAHRNLRLAAGELFGELAAISRTPRTATVVAEANTQLLEIRWQGLRDIMRYAPEWRDYVNNLYRENSLQSHLRETSWLRDLAPSEVKIIADSTAFETYGEFEWHTPYRSLSGKDATERLAAEPLIAAQGNASDGVLLIRSGFARLCRNHGSGQRTIAYLGKGETFGLAELVYGGRLGRPVPLQHSLRAVGYVDVLRIPTSVAQTHILPRLDDASTRHLCDSIAPYFMADAGPLPARGVDRHIDVGLLEFLLDHRTNNGAQAMLVNLNRCTRCDDCVRACAATHNNNPRFVRNGPQYEHIMVAHACMHCTDPVCMIGCPTGAISRDLTTGTVVLNDATCIGCGTCANSCPYHNILLTEIRDTHGRPLRGSDTGVPITRATKCDLCAQQPLGPACQRACPHDALIRMDMRDLPRLHSWLNR